MLPNIEFPRRDNYEPTVQKRVSDVTADMPFGFLRGSNAKQLENLNPFLLRKTMDKKWEKSSL